MDSEKNKLVADIEHVLNENESLKKEVHRLKEAVTLRDVQIVDLEKMKAINVPHFLSDSANEAMRLLDRVNVPNVNMQGKMSLAARVQYLINDNSIVRNERDGLKQCWQKSSAEIRDYLQRAKVPKTDSVGQVMSNESRVGWLVEENVHLSDKLDEYRHLLDEARKLNVEITERNDRLRDEVERLNTSRLKSIEVKNKIREIVQMWVDGTRN